MARNPHPVALKHHLDAAEDKTAWSVAHAKYHPLFRDFLQTFAFDDVLLVDLDGNVVYSGAKAPDFGTNLKTGPFAAGASGKLAGRAFDARTRTATIISDFEAYLPAQGRLADFWRLRWSVTER